MEVSDWSNFTVLVTVYDDVFMIMFPWLLTVTTVVVGDRTSRSVSDILPLPSTPLPSVAFIFSPTATSVG